MYVRQYLEIFINETGEHLQNLDDCMLILEKGPDNKNTIKELFRTLHSLAGIFPDAGRCIWDGKGIFGSFS